MRRLRLTRTTWVVTIALVVLAAAYVGALFVARQYYEPPSPDASTYNGEAGGAKAYYLYLARLGYDVGRLEEFESVPAGTGTIVLITPLVRYPTPSETRMIQRWVNRGGRLVLIGSVATKLHEALGFGFTHVASAESIARPSQPGALVRGVSRIALRDRARVTATDGAVTYLSDQNGAAMVLLRLGRGSIVMLADSFPVANRGLDLEDNYALAADLGGPAGGRILFDEFHHGYSIAPGPLGILSLPSRYALVALVIACALLLYGWGKRLGPAVSYEPAPQRSVTEYAYSLGGLFETAGARAEVVKMLAAGLASRAGRQAAVGADQYEALRGLVANLVKKGESEEISQEEIAQLGRQVYEARMGVERVGRTRRRKTAL